MQERIEIQEQLNNFFLSEILSLEQQKNLLRCPNHNQANSVCISSECSVPGLMCLNSKCQCRRIHVKCHHILIERVLESIEKHQKDIPAKVKQTYKIIYDMINQMIEKLSKLRTKFQKEQQYFGLRQEELQFLELINEKKIDEVNGKIISSLQKTFDVDVQLNKNTKDEIIKDFEINRTEFDKMCKHIQKSYLQTKGTKINLSNIRQLFEDSKIIQKNQDRQILNKWLCQVVKDQNRKLKTQLLFRASQNQFCVQKFDSKCNGKNNTLIIVKNQYDKIIGGFTSKAWKQSTGQYISDQKGSSFLFSLNMKEKFQNIVHPQSSIYSKSKNGPTFGKAHDFFISDKSNQNRNSFGKTFYTYNIKTNNGFKYERNQQNFTLFTGSPSGSTFKIKQYEVYQIKFD